MALHPLVLVQPSEGTHNTSAFLHLTVLQIFEDSSHLFRVFSKPQNFQFLQPVPDFWSLSLFLFHVFILFLSLFMSLLQDGTPQSNSISDMVSPYGHCTYTTVVPGWAGFSSTLGLQLRCVNVFLPNTPSLKPLNGYRARPPLLYFYHSYF